MTYLVHLERRSDILEHYGVKGMRWGVRKDLSEEQRAARTSKILKGTAYAVFGIFMTRRILKKAGPRIVSSILKRRAAKEGARQTANLLANSHGLTNYSAINLTYNAASGLWE